MLALPQVAAVAQLARKLGTPVGRPAVAASADNDIEIWVNATPEGDEIALSLEGWTVRPAAGPRLATILGGGSEAASAAAQNEWATDEELRIISISSEFAEVLGIDVAEAAGAPLTRILRLEEDASRRNAADQRAGRHGALFGPTCDAADRTKPVDRAQRRSRDGGRWHFAGFRGTAASETDASAHAITRSPGFDQALDDLLRSPIDRIIESAEQIVARSDGPLRGDYANYGNDIASAARHLLSVLRAMSDDPTQVHGLVDLAALASEAVIMLESSAEDRGVHIQIDRPEPLRARGQERAVIQILVNLIVQRDPLFARRRARSG